MSAPAIYTCRQLAHALIASALRPPTANFRFVGYMMRLKARGVELHDSSFKSGIDVAKLQPDPLPR